MDLSKPIELKLAPSSSFERSDQCYAADSRGWEGYCNEDDEYPYCEAEDPVICLRHARNHIELPEKLPKKLWLIFEREGGPDSFKMRGSKYSQHGVKLEGVNVVLYFALSWLMRQAAAQGYTHVRLEAYQ